MAGREAFVPEVAVDLEHLLEAAHHQPLEVKLRRDAQEQFHVQRVVVRGEGLGRGAAGDGVHHRRFDFEIAALHQEVADRLDDFRAHQKGLAGFLVGDQVEVALAVFRFLVGQAVEFLRQRTQGFGQQAQFGNAHRQFALVGLEQGALGGNDVAHVPVLESLVGLGADAFIVDVELDAAAHVLHRGEAGLAHHALEHHAAGDGDADVFRFQRFLVLVAMSRQQIARRIRAVEVVGEGDALLAQLLQLVAALGDELVFILGEGCVFLFIHWVKLPVSNWR